jgi:hypothetical protein
MAGGLDDAALEALANRGLLRRAMADVEAGKAEIVDEDDRAAELRVDGETVRLRADGVAKGACTCPAPGICRHRLAALILMREVGGAADDPPAPAVDWSEVFAAFDAAALIRFAGKAALREGVACAAAAEVSPRPGGFTVGFGDAATAVTFLSIGGLDAAVTKAPTKTRKATIVRAALAARAALGLPPVVLEAEAAPDAAAVAAKPDPTSTAQIHDFLERGFDAALALSSVAWEEEARRLSLNGRVEAMPRLAAVLRRIAAGLAALRRRDANADTGEVLSAMAEAYALSEAIAAATSPDVRARLIGSARQAYADLGDLGLQGLGARLWETPSGAYGVTAHFLDPSGARTFALTLARPDRSDPQFDPRRAFAAEDVWGLNLADLATAGFRLTGAKASTSGRLSTSAASRAVLGVGSFTREAVSAWPVAFDDWSRLEAHLGAAFIPQLASDPPRDLPVVLLSDRQAPAQFDELDQTLTWPICDQSGRWIGLALDYAGSELGRIEALEQAIESGRWWGILALARRAEGRLELSPYGLLGAEPRLLDFGGTGSARVERGVGLLDRLRLATGRARRGPQRTAAARSTTDQLLSRGWSSLLRRAELGRSLGGDTDAYEATSLAEALTTAGLPLLARRWTALGSGGAEQAADALRAAYATVTVQQARAQLLWMR